MLKEMWLNAVGGRISGVVDSARISLSPFGDHIIIAGDGGNHYQLGRRGHYRVVRSDGTTYETGREKDCAHLGFHAVVEFPGLFRQPEITYSIQ